MIKRRWPIFVLLTAGAGAFGAAAACAETGPDAGPRMNGCIGQECYDSSAANVDGATPIMGMDGSTPAESGPVGFPNPLAGTGNAATLVKAGFQYTEGPVWIGGHLLFSDSNANTIFQLSADEGSTTPVRTNAGKPNGNAVDPMGRLITCETNNRRVVRSAGDGTGLTGLTGMFMGNPYNAPNDVVVRSDGNIYFTDPTYGEDPDAAAPHQPMQGLYRINPAGMTSRVKQYASNPNGVGISPDGSTLYVNDTTANLVNKWSLAGDGSASAETKFADANGADGMAIDDAGNVYIAATTGILVFDKGGTGLGTITVGKQPSNCTFGGGDRKTLYITAQDSLFKIVLNVPGLP